MTKYRPKGTTTRTLTDEQVMQYRGAYFAQPPRITTRAIMEQTDLSMVSVRRMLNGETYRNVGMAAMSDVIAGDLSGDTIEASMRRMAAANGIVLDGEAAEAKAMLDELTADPVEVTGNPLDE